MDWTKVRVVVTGGAGFLGRAVMAKLGTRGAERVFVPRSRDYNLVHGEAVRRLLRDAKPDVVLHLAARVGGIGANQAAPGTFFYDNAMMGIQLLHECAMTGVGKVVVAGTVCAYPKFAPVPFKEEDLWNGYPEETNAPYGVATKILSVQSEAYRAEFGLNSLVIYPVNLYGPGDNFDLETGHVIPSVLRKFHEAKIARQRRVVLWGDGSPTREFLYVDDCAEGLLLAAERYESSQPLNLGSGEEVAISELAQRIAAVVGYSGDIDWDASKPNGQPRRRLDVGKAKQLLGFEAQAPLEAGLRKTYAAYRASLAS
jgi:GDP-L-fucose synthase